MATPFTIHHSPFTIPPALLRPLFLAILLLAFALRTHQLTQIPPGLTHDEANHAREALGVRDGVYLFYFPLNYGSEPFYSYTVAGNMTLLGENLFALRLVNVFFGLLAICLTYRWAKKAFGTQTGVLTAVLIATSFWPLASSREALRAGMLPFFMTAAIWFFWQLLLKKNVSSQSTVHRSLLTPHWLLMALCIAATLHIYLAARVAWLVFPLFLGYLGATQTAVFRRIWLPTLAAVLLGWLLAMPMFRYVQTHPEASTRLEMLDRPLQDLRDGNWQPLLQNGAEALLAFVWPGYGDQFLAYNIPGRPIFDVVSAVFFILGLFSCFYHWRKPAYFFVLLWFLVGIAPSLITGPTANTTRNLAALSAVYSLPAIGFTQLWHVAYSHWPRFRPLFTVYASLLTAFLWLSIAAWLTTRDYFLRWGQSPDVRGAYQYTLVEMLHYARQETAVSPLIFSTVYPGPAHDPSLGMLFLGEVFNFSRWVDARYALVLPNGRSAYALIPSSTPPHPYFAPFLTAIETVDLRPDDLDPSFTLYQLTPPGLPPGEPVNFDEAVQLLGAQWLNPTLKAGETAELLTIWLVSDPTRAGPTVPPAFTTDAVLFTHVLNSDGSILAQHDSLEAPSWGWQPGDLILQIHPVFIPPGTPSGSYETAVGLYDRTSWERLPILDSSGAILDTHTLVSPLTINHP